MKIASFVAVLFLFAGSAVYAEESDQEPGGLKLADLTAKGATRLSKEDLQALLPGAKVRSIQANGVQKFMENYPEGKLVASSSSDVAHTGKLAKISNNALGTWRIGDDATYCVQVEWKKKTESWCRAIFKSGDKYFGAKPAADGNSPVFELSFSR